MKVTFQRPEHAKKIREGDVIEIVRLVIAVASEKLLFPPDKEIHVYVRSARTRIGLVRAMSTSKRLAAWINPKGTRAEWAEEALRELIGTYAMREVIRARVEAKGIQTTWPSPAVRVKRESTTIQKLADTDARIAEWEQRLKDATRAQRYARTKLKDLRAHARSLRATAARQPVENLSTRDFSEMMRMKRERGEIREVLS